MIDLVLLLLLEELGTPAAPAFRLNHPEHQSQQENDRLCRRLNELFASRKGTCDVLLVIASHGRRMLVVKDVDSLLEHVSLLDEHREYFQVPIKTVLPTSMNAVQRISEKLDSHYVVIFPPHLVATTAA